MEKSSSRPANTDESLDDSRKPRVTSSAPDTLSPQLIADSLLSALEGGNIEQLEKTRHAFVDEASSRNESRLPDLATSLERRLGRRTATAPGVPDDDLRREEEALRLAEQELERRRQEVAAAKKRAEDHTKKQVAEEQRRAIEVETERHTAAHAERVKKMEAARNHNETDIM